MGCLDGITDSVDTDLSKLQETVEDREVQWATVHGGGKLLDMTQQLNNNKNAPRRENRPKLKMPQAN